MKLFTNGCFDLLHPGHADFLRRCRDLAGYPPHGEVVVGLDSDASVRRLKGPDRPHMTEADRRAMLEALRWVDRVDVFDGEAGLLALIERERPDVLVKGSEYALPGRSVVGAELVARHGGQVVYLPPLPGHSTTGTVGRVRGGVASGDVEAGPSVASSSDDDYDRGWGREIGPGLRSAGVIDTTKGASR